MGVTTPKSPDLRETDTANARYTDLNRANRGLGLSLIGNPDTMLGGILALPPNELKIPISYIESGLVGIGQHVLIGNRRAVVLDWDNDNGGTEAMLHLGILESDAPLPQGAVLAEENFINNEQRVVDHVIGIQQDASVDEALRRGGTTYGLIAAAPVLLDAKIANPSTWGATAQAQRKYLGFGTVTVTLDVYTDAGSTPYAGDITFDWINGLPDPITATVVGGAATVDLPRGAQLRVTDGAAALAEVQPHPGSDSAIVVPLVGDPATLVIHNAAAS